MAIKTRGPSKENVHSNDRSLSLSLANDRRERYRNLYLLSALWKKKFHNEKLALSQKTLLFNTIRSWYAQIFNLCAILNCSKFLQARDFRLKYFWHPTPVGRLMHLGSFLRNKIYINIHIIMHQLVITLSRNLKKAHRNIDNKKSPLSKKLVHNVSFKPKGPS